jgi:FAD/FMN-containing dehydrogenase/Fe-S oxidoreductase
MSGLSRAQLRTLGESGCEIRSDDLSRRLYATDASIYEVLPLAVALPRSPAEVAAVVMAARVAGVSITPRGAGTGLAGGAVGEGLVLDLARYNQWLDEPDLEQQTVRAGPGVVLDQLNAAMRRYGLWFGPDVATSSRATIGGMIANNSSGAHAPVYGVTADHIAGLEVVLADGRCATLGENSHSNDVLAELDRRAGRILSRHAKAIHEGLPQGLIKQWPGYGLDRALRAEPPGVLGHLVTGSEGTLATVTGATLRLVPLPAERGLAVIFFDSVAEAMQATVELLDLAPAAIEHIDRLVFDQTRGQAAFAPARDLLRLDQEPVHSLLLVELFDDVAGRLAEIERRRLGLRTLICADRHQQELVWSMRKAGLSLVTASPGPAKTTTCIEDVCVRPEQLPEYVAGLTEVLEPLGLEASFYGHAASGQLHVRPRLDLHTRDGVALLRQVADQVSDLCRSFGGSLAGEHGVGIARTEYLPRHLGPQLMAANQEVKNLLDADCSFNPGKIIDTGRWHIDRDLRLGPGSAIVPPFTEVIGFVDRDHSFAGNLEQCNGCGGCLKREPSMCPTFIATGEEGQSTRGRANIIRAALADRFGSGPPPFTAELEEVLGTCLSCKACRRECPSNVDLALLKTALLHARHQCRGPALADRVIAAADLLGRLGTAVAPLANLLLSWRPLHLLLAAAIGIDPEHPLPPFAGQSFDRWFAARSRPSPAVSAPRRGEAGRTQAFDRVILWDDTWVRFHEPGIGRAAVSVLEAAGCQVEILADRRCCGRPAASRGLLDQVRRLGEHNLALLGTTGDLPVIFLEPSCYSMFIEEYRQLELPGAEAVADRCHLLESFLLDLLDHDPGCLPLAPAGFEIAIHAHCHTRALADPRHLERLARYIPEAGVRLMDSGCCGMAGAFGMLRAKQELSRQVAEPLVAAIQALPQDTRLVAAGTSCRHQISFLTGTQPLHPAQLLAARLVQPAPMDENVTG